MELYIGQWEWAPDPDIGFYWRAPGGDAVGTVNLRSHAQMALRGGIPEGHGLFVYPGTRAHVGLLYHLGSDLERQTRLADTAAIETLLGKRVGETQVLAIVRELLLAHTDPTGQTGWKPLRGSLRRGMRLWLGGWGRVLNEAFAESHPAFATTIEVFRADYRRHRANDVPLEVLRKFTGAEMLKLYRRTGDDLLGILPEEYQGDGWRAPETTIGDTFTDTDSVSLDAHTATGANGGFEWTETTGTEWLISSNHARAQDANAGAIARAETDLSSDDHYTQLDRVDDDDANGNTGVRTRYDTVAEDCYHYLLNRTNTTTHRLFVFEAGTPTQIGSTETETGLTNPITFKLESDGSSHQMYRDGVAQGSAVTDATITGELRTGIVANAIAGTADFVEVDDFEAADLAAGANTRRYSLALTGIG